MGAPLVDSGIGPELVEVRSSWQRTHGVGCLVLIFKDYDNDKS